MTDTSLQEDRGRGHGVGGSQDEKSVRLLGGFMEKPTPELSWEEGVRLGHRERGSICVLE